MGAWGHAVRTRGGEWWLSKLLERNNKPGTSEIIGHLDCLIQSGQSRVTWFDGIAMKRVPVLC